CCRRRPHVLPPRPRMTCFFRKEHRHRWVSVRRFAPMLALLCGCDDPHLVASGGDAGGSPADAPSGMDGAVSLDGSVTIDGMPMGVLAIEPPLVRVPAGRNQIFVASDTATWSVMEPSGGTIDASGMYNAPDLPGTYHVAATSNGTTAVAT